MQQLSFFSTSVKAKPFLKWAGGKGQLLDQMTGCFPDELRSGRIKRYIEPFVGGGAAFFYIAQNYDVEEFFISDVNQELVLAYRTIKKDVNSLIERLEEIQTHFFHLTPHEQEEQFYSVRAIFNDNLETTDFFEFSPEWVERTAQIIFLNRTCYNGLFRVNSQGKFNVPYGRYKRPKISATSNLRAVSQILQRTEIQQGDFTLCRAVVDVDAFVYFDPPYRPISKTASFNSYSSLTFDDAEQKRLATFFRELDGMGAKLMLSNSDPKNESATDNFFEELYSDYRIRRVRANRMINCNGEGRGAISELIITNY